MNEMDTVLTDGECHFILSCSLSLSPQYRPDPGGYHYRKGSESEQLPRGDDGKENVS